MDKLSSSEQLFNEYSTIFKSVEIGKDEFKAIINSYNYFFEIANNKNSKQFEQVINSFFIPKKRIVSEINIADIRSFLNKDRITKEDKDKLDKLCTGFSFLMGHYKNMADIQSYKYFMDRHNETEKYGSNINKIQGYNSKTYWNMLIDDYQKAFEVNRKVLARLVCIDKIITGQQFKEKKILKESACNLIDDLKRSNINVFNESGANWDLVIFPLNRQIRNAASHLDFYYDDQVHMFLGEDKSGQVFSIIPEIVKNVLLPVAINNASGFVAAALLFKLKSDENLYKQALSILS